MASPATPPVLDGNGSETENVDEVDDGKPEERHLSIFDYKDIVDLLLNQPEYGSEPNRPPIIEVDSAPLENLDHIYHKQLQRETGVIPSKADKAIAVTEELLVPLDNLNDSRPPSSMSLTCPRSPFSSACSSGYESDQKESDSTFSDHSSSDDSDVMAWENSFSDLFPDLV